MGKTVPVEQRLWGRTIKTDTGCWEFQGARATGNGYGRIGYNGAVVWAHRVAYELAKGSIPSGLFVMHSCDNPPCVNPAHLRLGTHQDNMDDMTRKGRKKVKRGLANPLAKLSDDDVAAVRAARTAGEQHKSIAARYGIHPTYACRIAVGRSRAS